MYVSLFVCMLVCIDFPIGVYEKLCVRTYACMYGCTAVCTCVQFFVCFQLSTYIQFAFYKNQNTDS